jgi:hypothetical protein
MSVEPNFAGLEALLAGLTDQALRLDYNDQKSGYDTVEGAFDNFAHFYDEAIWVKDGEREEAIRTNEMWELHLDTKKDAEYKKYMAATCKNLVSKFTDDPTIITAFEKFKELFDVILTGEYSTAHLRYNDQLCNYASLQEAVDQQDDVIERDDWVSDEEYSQALASNTVWTLQWYPRTPIGFCTRHASSLKALLDYFQNQ